MKTLGKKWKSIAVFVLAALWALCVTAAAESGDNSLYSLGLENGECSPEFYYSTLEYTVTVPAGTTELLLNPITSDENANIIDISGTTLDNGTGTVGITVEAPNGAQVTYTLNVVPDGEAAAAETTAETEMSNEQKQEEELRRQAESEEALRQQAEIEANKQKVTTLTEQNTDLNNRINLLMKVLYGLVGFSVVLLFFMINQSLRNKDLKDDLKEARSQADMNNEFARKEQNMQSDYYYAPVHGVPQNNPMYQNMNQNVNPNMNQN
ncbi:MAG: cadherin-like beta sandwich domain-containing protein, partial [Eubacteriales bacterium]|nr:cadherin-like beta sandwich domain-containing protein [Eubacteriales bacterium]